MNNPNSGYLTHFLPIRRKMWATIDFTTVMSGSFVLPLDSKRMCANFETYTSSGSPYRNV